MERVAGMPIRHECRCQLGLQFELDFGDDVHVAYGWESWEAEKTRVPEGHLLTVDTPGRIDSND